MKKFLTYALLCTLLASAFAVNAAAAVPEAAAAYGTPVVDAVIDDVWANAETYTANELKDGTEENITTNWKAMWDENNLYFLIEVSGDTKHFFNGDQSWGDGCEIYMDVLNLKPSDYTDDSILQIGWDAMAPMDNAFKGTEDTQAALPGKYNVAAKELDDGYIYEVSFALEEFNSAAVLEAGTVVGFDVQVNSKCDESESRTSAYGWADTINIGWQDPSVFGNLTLMAAPVVEEVVETAPQTFDAGVIAAVAAVISAAGFAVSKKR